MLVDQGLEFVPVVDVANAKDRFVPWPDEPAYDRIGPLAVQRFELVSEARFEKPLGYPSWNAPILSHGVLYVRGSERLVALELIPSD